jgi:small-conductance mechanosensitive channel
MDNAKATEQFNNIFEIFNLANLVQLSLAVLVLVLGFGLSRLAKRAVRGLTHNHLSPQQTMIAARTASLVVWIVTLSVALQKAGIDIGVALGAAGIFTVAIGFAAQTSVSNLISGLFLMAEKPFVIGEEIQVGTTTGVVISIDLLSAKLRTADNLLVRIPNEALLKSEIINLTRFPKRRVDILLDLAHQTDVGKVKQLLDGIVAGKEKIDQDPAPQLVFVGFGETALKLRFSVWTDTANAADLKTQLLAEIKQAFQQEGIAFPNVQRTLIVGAPVEVKMVGTAAEGSVSTPQVRPERS